MGVADALEELIRQSYKVEARLPSEAKLRSTLGASVPDIRGAISALRAEGILTTRPHVGHYVVRVPKKEEA
jgi:DNA-binding GntR family transcriptional regulator